MARKYTGKITTSHVERKQKNGDVYVYEEQRRYDSEKGYAVTVASKLLGVKKNGIGPILSTRLRRKFVNVTKTETSPVGEIKAVRKHVGMMDIIDHIAETSSIDLLR